MSYKKVSQETVRSGDYITSYGIASAKEYSKDHGNRKIYQMPNGAYAVRRVKHCTKHATCRTQFNHAHRK